MAIQSIHQFGGKEQAVGAGGGLQDRGTAAQMIAGMMGSSSGGGSGSGSSSGASTGGSTFVTPSALVTLLGDIPIANDGDVITADYHNTLREALLALAAFLGQGGVAQSLVQTWGPELIRETADETGKAGWELSPKAANGFGKTSAWMPVGLAEGAQLQSFTVINARGPKVRAFAAALSAYSLTDPASAAITLADVKQHDGDRSVQTDSASISPAGSNDPSLIASLGRVDNSKYRYAIHVDLESTTPAEHVSIYGFQVTYSFV